MAFDVPALKFKSLQYRSNRDKISIGEDSIQLIPTSQPGKYDVGETSILIKVHSAALNPIDIALYNSSHPWISFGTQGIGKDYSGTVVSLGSTAAKTTGLKVDDKVCGLFSRVFGKGTVSEYILLDSTVDKSISVVPSNLSLEEASSWPLVYMTARQMIGSRSPQKPELDKFSKVLVLGAATSVGKFAISILKNQYHVKDIVATCSAKSEEKVKELGASYTIDYTKYPTEKGGIYEPVEHYAVQHGGKFDLILDCCGNYDLIGRNIEFVIKSDGDYATICGDVKYDYETVTILENIYDNLRLPFRAILSFLGRLPYNYHFISLEASKKNVESGKKEIEAGECEVIVDSTYKFEDFEKAIERLKSNRAVGKVIINVSED